MDASKITDYAKRLVEFNAHQLAGKAGFTKDDVEDIKQELLLDILERLPKFDPEKSSYNTFIDLVIRNKVQNLISARNWKRRDWRRESASLQDIIINNEGEPTERGEAFSEDDVKQRLGKSSPASREMVELGVDVDDVLSRLPAHLRILCETLREASISEVARKLGIPRTTVHERIRKLRRIFEDAGLKIYLPAARHFSGRSGKY